MGIRTKRAKGKQTWVTFTVVGDFGRPTAKSSLLPSARFRRAIAQNIEEMEAFMGTNFSRAADGRIVSVIGGGAWGVVFRLENGSCLKVSADPVEGANALFWKQRQVKKPSLLSGTTKVYDVFKIKDKQGKLFSCVRREYVDIPRYFPTSLEAGLRLYQDNLIMLCESRSQMQSRKNIWFQAARMGLETAKPKAKGLVNALAYAWNSGMPQLDAGTTNLGIRTKSAQGVRRGIGNLVLFDYGGVSTRCWKRMTQKHSRRALRVEDYVSKYDKKVPVL